MVDDKKTWSLFHARSYEFQIMNEIQRAKIVLKILNKIYPKIIVPLKSEGRTVYIDLGWTDFDTINSKEFNFRTLNNELYFEGILVLSKERKLFSPKPDIAKNNWYLMNVDEMDNHTKLKSEQYILKVMKQEYFTDLLNEFTAINIPNNHLQYAITWFVLAIAIAIMYLTFIYKNILKK